MKVKTDNTKTLLHALERIKELEEQNKELRKTLYKVKHVLSKCRLETCDYVQKICNNIIDEALENE